MSLPKQFSTKHLLIAMIICMPLLLHAQAKYSSKKEQQKGVDITPAPVSGGIYQAEGAPMPAIRVVHPDNGRVYTDQMVKNDANLFIMMFNPSCEHCEDMTIDLEKHIDLFKKSNILLMAAPTMGPYIGYFEQNTKADKYPALKVGLDSSNFIGATFNYVALPQINIYNADRKLIKTFSGITTIDSLKPYIQ